MINKFYALNVIFIKIIISVQFNVNDYSQIPPLYKFDDYDKCLQNTSSTYCVVYAEIEPNYSSPLWLHIGEHFNDTEHHYRHDILYFGVCVKRCELLINTLKQNEKDKFIHQRINNNEVISYFEEVHERERENRKRYEHLINVCVNHEFKLRYNLQLRTFIEYCVNEKKAPVIRDGIDVIAYLLFGSLVLCTFLSTLYDYFLKHQRKSLNHNSLDFYKRDPENPTQRLLTTFSICRNYNRLIAPAKEQDLEFFNGFRVICVFAVVLAHVIMTFMTIQIGNPQLFEELIKLSWTIVLQNGSVILQIFFIISGFLLKYKFDKSNSITPNSSYYDCIKTFGAMFIERYLRFALVLLFLILFNISFLKQLGDGPFWSHCTIGEVYFCRKYWWKNIFMINNLSVKHSCSHHTWYLGADMQQFFFILILIISTAKYPQLKQLLYYIVGFLSILIPFSVTYIFKLNGIYHITPETYRYFFFKDSDTLYKSYLPGYTNVGAYLGGVICADLFANHVKRQKFEKIFKSHWYEFIYPLLYTAWLVLLLSGLLITKGILQKPFGTAVYDGLYRNLWVLVTILVFCGMIYRVPSRFYTILNSSICRPLARISFQTYIWHVTVLRYMIGSYRQPVYVSFIYLIAQVFYLFVISNVVGFCMVMLLEYPLEGVMRFLLNKDQVKLKAK